MEGHGEWPLKGLSGLLLAPSLPPGDEVPRMEPNTVSTPLQTHASEKV